MKRDPNLPLTETTFYILLALTTEAHGYLIMTRVEELSGGHVRLAPGTLYGALDNLLKKGFIVRVPSDDPRRKVYRTTDQGNALLDADAERMSHMLDLHTHGRTA